MYPNVSQCITMYYLHNVSKCITMFHNVSQCIIYTMYPNVSQCIIYTMYPNVSQCITMYYLHNVSQCIIMYNNVSQCIIYTMYPCLIQIYFDRLKCLYIYLFILYFDFIYLFNSCIIVMLSEHLASMNGRCVYYEMNMIKWDDSVVLPNWSKRCCFTWSYSMRVLSINLWIVQRQTGLLNFQFVQCSHIACMAILY